MVVPASIEMIRAALQFVDPVDTDDWIMAGMALKSEFGEAGFDLFSAWSENAKNYDAKAVKSRWKSFKPGGAIKIGTLIYKAQQNKFDPKQYAPAVPPTKVELDKIKAERAEAERAAAVEQGQLQAAAAEKAKTDWANATVDGASTYLERKAVKGYGVRYSRADVLVPLYSAAGELRNLQRIKPTGDKFFLENGQVSGCFHVIGQVYASSWLLLAEGYATAAALHQATGYAVVVTFNAGNIQHVAATMRKLHPSAKVLICSDDDADTEKRRGKNPGVLAAVGAAKAVQGFWCKPDGLPEGKTDFNDLAAAAGIDEVKQQIAAAIARADNAALAPATPAQKGAVVAPKQKAQGKPQEANKKRAGGPDSGTRENSSRPFFNVNEDGVWYHGFSQNGDPLPPQWICSELKVTAQSRDSANGEWGYLLEFADADGNLKRWAMPASMLAGDGTGYRAILLSMGLRIGAGVTAKNQLTVYIQTQKPELRVRCTDRIGWHGGVYVLPDRTIGESDELVMFQAAGGVVSQFRQRGTLTEWRDNVSIPCRGNSRMLFCLSSAFAAPLMHLAHVSSGGFHIWGDSSSGKSTAFKVAGSVFGGSDYPRSWHATGNALESTATQHSDALLLLDEIAQVDPKSLGDTVYMLANESGKARATQSATARKIASWRLLFLSDGEVSLSSHMEQAGKNSKAGHDVRMAHIAADAGKGLGVFDTLHDFESGAALSDHLVKMARQYYGTAGMALIEYAVSDFDNISDALTSGIAQLVREMCPENSHGQVARVAARFALVGLAGEMATAQGITGWETGEAIAGARTCFATWLEGRGGSGNVEHVSILRQVSAFFQAHGNARFTPWHRATDDHAPNTINRAGLRKMIASDGTAINSHADHHKAFGDAIHPKESDMIEQEYYVLPEVYRNEICKGFDHKTVSKLLIKHGMLEPGKKSATRSERLPGIGNISCYRFKPAVLNGGE
jgi:putative DNA primase/helicase